MELQHLSDFRFAIPPFSTIGRVKLIFLICFLTTSTSLCQILAFKSYSIKDGLPSNDVGTIFQDSRGFMWFGTTDGISVFDGQSFKNYTLNEGLLRNFISGIREDEEVPGKMWILAGSRVCILEGDHIRTLSLDGVRSFFQETGGRMWLTGPNAVHRIDGDSISAFNSGPLAEGAITMIGLGDSLFWFASTGHILAYSTVTDTVVRIETGQYADGVVWSMQTDREGNLWVAMSGGYILQIRGAEIIHVRQFPISTSWLTQDNSGYLWFGGYEGIGYISKKEFQSAVPVFYDTRNGLPENTVRSIYVDREQNLWVGGRDRGIAKLSSFRMYRFPLENPPRYAFSHNLAFVASDSNGHVWAVSGMNVIEYWRDDHGGWHKHMHRNIGLPDTAVALFLDAKGGLWIACGWWEKELRCYGIILGRSSVDHSTLQLKQSIDVERIIPQGWSLAIIAGRNGDIWQSLGGVGVVHLDPRRDEPLVRIYGKEEGVPLYYVRSLYQDRSGNIWGGSLSEGLFVIPSPDKQQSRMKKYKPPSGLQEWGIWSVFEDQTGAILVGSNNRNISIIRDDSVQTMRTENGLAGKTVYSIAEDMEGRLWVGTSVGIAREEKPGSKSFVQSRGFAGSSVRFCGTTSRGLLWCVTPTEICFHDYRNDRENQVAPPVYLKSLRVNGVAQPYADVVTLKHVENNCEIGFAGLSFRDEESVQYRYRLIGAEKEWNGPVSTTSVTYGHLDPGSYRFEVKAVSIDGLESAIPARLAITILPPFWETWWFRSSVVLIFLVTGPMIYYLRVSKLKKEELAHQRFSHQLIQSQEAERKRVAGELHDGLGQDLMVIINRAQMALRLPDSSGRQIQEVINAATRAIDNVREIAFNLSPYHLEQVGLVESIKSMVEKVSQSSGIAFTVTCDAVDNVLTKEAQMNVYRVVQESVNNILKHSHASQAWIHLMQSGYALEIKVEDNGKGFDQSTRPLGAGSGFGLAGLAERVKLLKGTLGISSRPGDGTLISIVIPVNNEKEEA